MKKGIFSVAILMLCSLVSVSFAETELSSQQLDTLIQNLLEKSSHYEETLDKLAGVMQGCADQHSTTQQKSLYKNRLEKSYPTLKDQAPAQRALMTLNPEDIQLKKLDTQKLEKRFWFFRSDGGSACPED